MGYVDEVLADNPTALWTFDESSGNPVSTNGVYTAVNTGGALLDQDGPKGGRSVYFDGVDDRLEIGGGFPDFIQSGTFSFEVWVKFGPQVSDYPTFARRDGNGKAWLLRTRGPNTADRVHELETWYNGETIMTSPATFADSAWHHVVVVSSLRSSVIYVDGVKHTLRNGSAGTGGTGTGSPLYLGYGASGIEYFQGHLAFPAVYPKALSQTRVQAHYNAVHTEPPVELIAGEAETLQLQDFAGPVAEFSDPVEPPFELLSGFATGLTFLSLQTTVEMSPPPLTLRAGFATGLTFLSLQLTFEMGEPPLPLLSGFAWPLSLKSCPGPTVVMRPPPLILRSGITGVLKFDPMRSTVEITTPPAELFFQTGLAEELSFYDGYLKVTVFYPEVEAGTWRFDVLMPDKGIRVEHHKSSLTVRNARKRIRAEVRSRVKAY